MTISRQERVSNIRSTLLQLLDRLGDHAIWEVAVWNDDAEFANVYSTTWKELAERGLVVVRYTSNSSEYQLSGYGWLSAIKLSGQLETAEFRGRFGKLNAVLKGLVKGRSKEGFVQLHVAAAKAGVSEEWLYNLLESRIWEREFRRTGALLDESRTWVSIPIDFGMVQL